LPILDFTEIPSPTSGISRDQFELFAAEFLDFAGFRVIVRPDRGPDAGRDLVVEEVRTGVAGETRLRWLVSCKHNAHSGASVTPNDEPDIHDRVRMHRCDAFLAFYSTIPSSGLAAKLNADSNPFEVQIFDRERIETTLLGSPKGLTFARRFFPSSFSKWQAEHPEPADLLFFAKPELSCKYCAKDLLFPEPNGIVVMWSSLSPDRVEDVYWCCKGACDQMLNRQHWKKGLSDSWEDVPDLIAPMAYIRLVLTTLNGLNNHVSYAERAVNQTKELLFNLFPLVCRQMTEAEKRHIQGLQLLPSYFGGWGYETKEL
jgi:hypothetical protein